MPQMFDWIFFAIILPPPLYLLWDLLRDRAAPTKQMTDTGSGMGSSMTRPSRYAVPGATTASSNAVGSGAGTLDPVGMPAETTAQRDASMGKTR
jgi:hypothetical protein